MRQLILILIHLNFKVSFGYFKPSQIFCNLIKFLIRLVKINYEKSRLKVKRKRKKLSITKLNYLMNKEKVGNHK